MNTRLQNKIMRRIYYAYALKVGTNPTLVLGFFMLALMIMLTHFVSLGNVLANMMHVETAHLGRFFYNAILNTEAWTLLILGLLIFSAFSLRVKIKTPEGVSHYFARQH